MSSATDAVYGLLFFCIILTGMGMFSVGTLTKYGVTSYPAEYESLVATANMETTIGNMSSTMQSGSLDSTNILGVPLSIGTMAWTSLKMLLNLIDVFTTLPSMVLNYLGLGAASSWISGYIVAGVTFSIAILLIEANTGVKL